MAPDFQNRLSAIIRSLEEVIFPAIDEAHKPAREQAQLCLVNLRIMSEQYRFVYHLALAELDLFHRLQEDLSKVAASRSEAGLRERIDACLNGAPRGLGVPSFDTVDGLARECRELADEILKLPSVHGDAAEWGEISRLVLEHSRKEEVMRRSWMAGAGLVPRPEMLPSFAEIVSGVTGQSPCADRSTNADHQGESNGRQSVS